MPFVVVVNIVQVSKIEQEYQEKVKQVANWFNGQSIFISGNFAIC